MKELVRAAERVVSAYFDQGVALRVEQVLPDRLFSVIVRVRTVAAPSHVPGSFVVKAAAPGHAHQVYNDWAALQLLTDLSAGREPLGPRCYGGDRATPLVVMEDLGPGDGSPHELVEGDDPEAATASLLAYIRAVARLHVDTRGRRGDYLRLRGAIDPPKPLYHDPWSDAAARTEQEITAAIREYHDVLGTLGLTAAAGVDDEIAEVTRRVEVDPGPLLALCQGDQNGQGNCLLADGRLRLHDFGSGGFRHALVEGLPHRITWGCIRRVPETVAAAMDRAYQEAHPDLADDATFRRAATDAMTRWHVFHVIWRVPDALRRDHPRNPEATLRQQVVAWIDAYVDWADDGTALARTARRLVERLRERWPAYTHTIGYLPAYGTRS